MRKIIALILSLTLVLGTVSAVSANAQFNITTDTSVQQGQIAAFNELKAMFAADAALTDIKQKYIDAMQSSVTAVNSDIDQKIIFTLDAAIAGQLNQGQAKQAIDKGLQWYFYSSITNLTKSEAKNALIKGDQAKASAALDQAIELYAGALQGTAGKRDKGFVAYDVKTQDLLDNVIIPGLQKAVSDNDIVSYNLYRQMLDKTLIKMFHLATLQYAEKAPKTEDPEKAKAQVTEGYFFFMPIFKSLQSVSKKNADFIEQSFANGDPSKLDVKAIKAAYAGALNAKIAGYVNKTIFTDLAKGDLAKAQEHAMEGNMFLAAEEVLIKEQLGVEDYQSASAHAEMYFAAVKAGNADEAMVHAFSVLKIIAKLDGVHFKLNTKALTVNGAEKFVAAPSFINPETNRTLVPTRFIAEALGAQVDYVETTKTVIITKDGVKTELQVGSDNIVQNGEKVEKLTLDQPVIIKDDYSYIPLRAVAELLGSKVFFSNYEIVITN
jgi:hypothetical protein